VVWPLAVSEVASYIRREDTSRTKQFGLPHKRMIRSRQSKC